MKYRNVSDSLEAAERALGQLSQSLGAAGFEAGSSAYVQMAEVLISQAMWMDREGDDRFDDRFRHVAALADTVHGYLQPYVSTMERLMALRGVVSQNEGSDESTSLSGRIVEALAGAGRGLSITALRDAVGGRTSAIRQALEALLATGLVEKSGSASRPVYTLAEGGPHPTRP